MQASIRETSRAFFREVALPILERSHPETTAQIAFGVFGYGSEAFGLDDSYSRDHHWGLRVDAVMPQALFASQAEALRATLTRELLATFQGHSLREGHLAGAGVAFDSLEGFLQRTIGLDRPPQTNLEWLQAPEEDLLHLMNGEVWRDPLGRFTEIRRHIGGYYPEPVRLRRLAHWCRYFSGMGTYALKRAILRENAFYAATAFGKAIRWGAQIAFLLERQYFPYDKWLMVYLQRLPRLGATVYALVEEASQLTTSWERKLELLDQMADLYDRTMVADGILRPHPPFRGSETSGYRLLEHAYAEIIQSLPAELKTVVPMWDQIYLEQFHSRYVDGLDSATWHHLLDLHPIPPEPK